MMANVNQEREIKRGDVYWCTLEGKGSVQGGLRPVMVVSNDRANKFSPVVNVAPLSTQLHKCKLPTHVMMTKEEYKGIHRDSFLMAEQTTLVQKSSLQDLITHIAINDEMDNAIGIALGLVEVESTYLKRIKENIRIKVESIKVLDVVIYHHLSKGRDVILIQDDISERRMRVKDLEIYCKEVNQLVDNYYDVNCIKSVNKNIRLVG